MDFFTQLHSQNDAAWSQVLDELQSSIHPVDQKATRIWFSFFPVKLWRALIEADSMEAIAKKLILKGRYLLCDQIDTSAEFLYGHRYWPQVKAAVSEYAEQATIEKPLAEHIRIVARRVADTVKTDASLLMGITAVAFGTLQQTGAELFGQPAAAGNYGKAWNRSADQIVADRTRDDSQGLFGFLKSVDKQYTVTFRESQPGNAFKVVHLQDVTMAAAQAKVDASQQDSRCRPGEGPIPVECRAASCGTCWVGVLSPTEKILPPNDREKNKWPYFGYEGFTGDANSPIRLACQMKATGNVTLVIPPWCGMIGKLDAKEEQAVAAVM